MLIVRMMGGMGNQLFQYALYRALLNRGEDVKIDDISFLENRYPGTRREPMLETHLGLSYERATEEDIANCRKQKEYNEKGLNYNRRVFRLHHAYLVGYWQTERYFSEPQVTQLIRAKLQAALNSYLSGSFQLLLQEIQEVCSVSIHIRRTDYLQGNGPSLYGNICTEQYYEKALQCILRKNPQSRFYIFSDDKEWAASHYIGENFHVIGTEYAFSDTEEFLLMSVCRHHILANSSFSWWSAWIRDTPEKIILAPSRWINRQRMHDIYTPRMTRI